MKRKLDEMLKEAGKYVEANNKRYEKYKQSGSDKADKFISMTKPVMESYRDKQATTSLNDTNRFNQLANLPGMASSFLDERKSKIPSVKGTIAQMSNMGMEQTKIKPLTMQNTNELSQTYKNISGTNADKDFSQHLKFLKNELGYTPDNIKKAKRDYIFERITTLNKRKDEENRIKNMSMPAKAFDIFSKSGASMMVGDESIMHDMQSTGSGLADTASTLGGGISGLLANPLEGGAILASKGPSLMRNANKVEEGATFAVKKLAEKLKAGINKTGIGNKAISAIESKAGNFADKAGKIVGRNAIVNKAAKAGKDIAKSAGVGARSAPYIAARTSLTMEEDAKESAKRMKRDIGYGAAFGAGIGAAGKGIKGIKNKLSVDIDGIGKGMRATENIPGGISDDITKLTRNKKIKMPTKQSKNTFEAIKNINDRIQGRVKIDEGLRQKTPYDGIKTKAFENKPSPKQKPKNEMKFGMSNEEVMNSLRNKKTPVKPPDKPTTKVPEKVTDKPTTKAPEKTKVKSEFNEAEMRKKYNLDEDISKLPQKEKVKVVNQSKKNLQVDAGKRIINRLKTKDPQKAVDFYKQKYNLPGKIEVKPVLSSTTNPAKINIMRNKSGEIVKTEIQINPKMPIERQMAGLRHEIEHLIDETKGYKSIPAGKIKNAKTPYEYYSQARKGHHKEYGYFEADYLLKALKRDADEGIIAGKNINDVPVKTEVKANVSQSKSIEANQNLESIKNQRTEAQNNIVSDEIRTNLEDIESVPERIGNSNVNDRVVNTITTGAKEKLTLRQKIKNKAEWAYEKFVDDFYRLNKAGEESYIRGGRQKELFTNLKNAKTKEAKRLIRKQIQEERFNSESISHKLAKFKRSNSTVDYILGEKLVDRMGREIRKNGFKDVLKAPEGQQQQFEAYLMHRHNLARYEVEKPIWGFKENPVTSAESRKIIDAYEKEFPGFKELANKYNDTLYEFMDEWAVKSGLVDKDLYKMLKQKYPDYVPTYRVFEAEEAMKSTNRIRAGKIIKEAKGGSSDILSPSYSIPVLIQKTVRASRKNEIFQNFLSKVIENPKLMNKYAEIVKIDDGLANELGIMTANIKNISDDSLENLMNIFDNPIKQSKRGNYLTVMEQGKPVTLKINDKNLWKVFEKFDSFNGSDEKAIVNFVRKISESTVKATATRYNPFFGIRNAFRDIPTGYVMSKNSSKDYVKNLATGLRDILADMKYGKKIGMKQSETFQQYKALTGTQGNLSEIEKSLKDTGKVRKFFDRTLELINVLGYITETNPRYAEFKATLKRGGTMDEALFNAGEVTTDFTRSGIYTKTADAFTPYLNAGTQGLDKFARGIILEAVKHKNYTPLIRSIGITTVPSLVLYGINRTMYSDEYDKLPGYVRDNNFCIPMPGGKFFKIPKSRETGVILGSLFERLSDGFLNKSRGFSDVLDYGNSVMTAFTVSNPLESNIFTPISNLLMGGNKDFFKRDIVPQYMLNKKTPKYLQYDDKTSLPAKFMGQITKDLPIEELKLSPKQVDYLIKSYIGVIGQALGATSKTKMVKTPYLPFKIPSIQDLSVNMGFVTDTKYTNQNVNDFYKTADKAQSKVSELDQLYADKKKGLNMQTEFGRFTFQNRLTPEQRKKYNTAKTKLKKINDIKERMSDARDKEDYKQLDQLAKLAKLYKK